VSEGADNLGRAEAAANLRRSLMTTAQAGHPGGGGSGWGWGVLLLVWTRELLEWTEGLSLHFLVSVMCVAPCLGGLSQVR
jgi:hypothetical protein